MNRIIYVKHSNLRQRKRCHLMYNQIRIERRRQKVLSLRCLTNYSMCINAVKRVAVKQHVLLSKIIHSIDIEISRMRTYILTHPPADV